MTDAVPPDAFVLRRRARVREARAEIARLLAKYDDDEFHVLATVAIQVVASWLSGFELQVDRDHALGTLEKMVWELLDGFDKQGEPA